MAYLQFIFQPTAKTTKGATQYLTWIQGKMCREHRNYDVTMEFITVEYRNCDSRNVIEDFKKVYFFLSLKGKTGFAANVSRLE